MKTIDGFPFLRFDQCQLHIGFYNFEVKLQRYSLIWEIHAALVNYEDQKIAIYDNSLKLSISKAKITENQRYQ